MSHRCSVIVSSKANNDRKTIEQFNLPHVIEKILTRRVYLAGGNISSGPHIAVISTAAGGIEILIIKNHPYGRRKGDLVQHITRYHFFNYNPRYIRHKKLIYISYPIKG